MRSFRSLFPSFAVLSLSVVGRATSFSSVAAESARPWQRGFQTPASPIAEGIIAFHDDLRIFLTAILCFVRYVLVVAFRRFGVVSTEHATPVDRLIHASTLEVV